MSEQSSKYVRFGAAMGIILVSLGYLAYTGVQESKSYYVTIQELRKMDSSVYAKRLRVAGNVVPGSIKRQGTRVEFTLKENELTLPVVYSGTESLPDTFKDGAQAIIEGDFTPSGTFRAEKIQAKCASKYQAAPPGTAGRQSSKLEMGNSKPAGSN